MSAITLSETLDLDVPAAVAWAVVSDYRRDPEWRAGVLAMVPSPPGPVVPGTTTVERIRVAGRTYRNDGEVTAVGPDRRFEWRTTAGAVASGARVVEVLDEARCRVRLDLCVTPTGPNRLLAPLLRRVLRRNLAADVHRLAALVARVDHPRDDPRRRPSRSAA